MDFWHQFLGKDFGSAHNMKKDGVINVNAHLHTPYSFSAFDSIEQLFEQAKSEGLSVLGINDFNTSEGFDDWAENCTVNKIFPLFNAEFIALSKIDQEKGIQINDPKNPGRIYLSGKGMSYPFNLKEPYFSTLNKIQHNANAQVFAMCAALNSYLERIGLNIKIDINNVMSTFTKGMIRERHLAKALRVKVFETISNDTEKLMVLNLILGKEMLHDLQNHSAIEGALRDGLLKAGGAAFIEESTEMFADFELIRKLIISGGGIPTYPLLADSLNGGFTSYEVNKYQLLNDLQKKGFYAVEFIPNRNTMEVLEEYSKFFVEKGFIVSFGSEHNTPDLLPIKLLTVNKLELSPLLKEINYKGACAIAAHQYLYATTGIGYLDADGIPGTINLDKLIVLGDDLIKSFID